MLIFDGHLDLALNGVDWNRDLRLTVDDIRAQERSLGMTEAGRCTNTVSFPELKRAKVGWCLATLLARQEPQINHTFGWISPQACYAMAHAHLAYYRAMEREGALKILRTRSEFLAHVNACQAAPDATPLGIILTMEGADPLLSVDTIEEFYEAGLRAIGLTHYGANRYGGGTRCEVGLALEAKPLLERIERLGMTVDMTHLSDPAFPQVLDLFHGRIHASHQNARELCHWQRQFTDTQLRAVIQRDGVIGVAFDVIMLQEGYVRGVTPPAETMEAAVRNIDHICQLAGDTRHVAIGSDLDGGYGNEQTPVDLKQISDLQKLVPLLEKRGYSGTDIAAIFHGNWIRFFSEVLP